MICLGPISVLTQYLWTNSPRLKEQTEDLMFSLSALMTFVHLIGLAAGVGAATVKLVLLLRCRADRSFVPVYLKVVRPITRLIILGLVLLTLSGIVILLIGYPWSDLLLVKLVLVGAVWILGPVIDNIVEPKFSAHAAQSEATSSDAFLRVQQQYLAMEVVATGLFYVIIALWVLL